MYACIYELWKNCRGRTGRVDGNSKVLQEVLADLKKSMHGDFLWCRFSILLRCITWAVAPTPNWSIWPKMSWSVEMFSSRIHDQWNHIWTSYLINPLHWLVDASHTQLWEFFLSGHSIETLGMKNEVGILRISKLCTEQYFLILIISIIKLRSSVITNLRVLLTASISLLFLPFEVDGYR